MQLLHPSIKQALIACLFAAPLFQLIGDSMWISHNFSYSWSIWREASYIFFIPVGMLLARLLAAKNAKWTVLSCALFVTGCFGSAAMMPLFRLGAFYPVVGHNEFPAIVQSVFDKNAFAVTLYIPGLCFPVSLVLFGIGFLKYKVLPFSFGFALILSGVFFWLGNAGEIDPVLVIGDAWLLVLFCWLGYLIFRGSRVSKSRASSVKTESFTIQTQDV